MTNFIDTFFSKTPKTKSRDQLVGEFYASLDANTSAKRDPQTSGISRQIAHIKNMGLYARPTRFTFEIAGMPYDYNTRLVRNCQSISMPGRSLFSSPVKVYGPPNEYVYEANYANELQVTFRVGEDMFERDFFEQWMNSAISIRSMDLSYPDDYVTSMKIYQLDRLDNYLYCSELYNVFCKNIGDMEFSSDASDQIQTVTVTLSYAEYQVIGRISQEEATDRADTAFKQKMTSLGNEDRLGS
jgi:hypothetical protein